MGCNVRDKPLRGGGGSRKHRHSAKPPPPPLPDATVGNLTPSPFPDLSIPNPNPNPSNPNPNPIALPNPNPNSFDDSGWGYCTEEQLEELLMKNLDFVYKEALSRLLSLGYDETLALRAILSNGYCYGSMDVLSNVLHNALAFLNTDSPSSSSSAAAADPPAFGSVAVSAFSDLRHLQEYSVAGMVCLLQQVRPHLTRGDAMWCLLMSELHVGRASTIEIPPPAAAAASPAADLPSPMKTILKRRSAKPILRPRLESEKDSAESDIVASVLKSLENMSIEEERSEKVGEVVEDQKKEMILDLVRQIRDLEVQVKERKEWAQQKAMQAARKLSNDLTEVKVLRMEREENQRVKKGKQALEDSTMKRLSEMESALKKASGQVDRANAAVRKLETENAEIRAEMEASKLSASESVTTCLEVAKREKKCLKRLLAWEKQREKLQEEIAEERKKIVQQQQQLSDIKEAQKQGEIKWRQEIKAKEQAVAQVEDERRAKEATDASIKRKHEVLRRKIEIDFQRHKDDIQRLEDELSRLKASTGSIQPNNPSSNSVASGGADVLKPANDANAKIAQGFNKAHAPSRKVNCNRECVICMKDEVSVVFLPCAHQVLCVTCNDNHERRPKPTCPCCHAQIEQRIRVFGASC